MTVPPNPNLFEQFPIVAATGAATGVAQTRTSQPVLSLDETTIRYEPFPIGFARTFLDRAFYDELVRNWPDNSLFLYKPALGNKFSLSEVNHPENYHRFVNSSEPWRMVHRLVKSPAFIEYVLDSLLDHNIDIGCAPGVLSSRFEFSMLAGAGGCIKPHTDAPNKLVTLVLSILAENEWNPAWGGGTAILKPKDVTKTFNHMNVQLDFDEVECLESFPFVPNACVLFVKTFNSYHAVYPIQGMDAVPRRSLTINIEDPRDARLASLKGHRPGFRKGGRSRAQGT